MLLGVVALVRRQTAGRTGVVGSAVALVRRLAVLPRIFERGLIRVSGFPDIEDRGVIPVWNKSFTF